MTTPSAALSTRLSNGDLVLIDGATGTELERHGVPMVQNAWCGSSHLTHPDIVRQVHVSHIQAGAELIIANTYASSRHLLAWAGMEDDFEELNRVGIELALEARVETGRSDIVVAGSISTSQQNGPLPPIDVARVNFEEQARIQADAGAELIVLEMMRDIDQTQVCIDAVAATGLPIWLGYSCVLRDDVAWLFNEGSTLSEGLDAIAGQPVELVAIMHSETEDTHACLDVLDEKWNGPVGVYAQSGRFEHPNWIFNDVISEQDYGDACMTWVDRGVQVIGGCCGIGPEHIAHLRPRIDAAQEHRSTP